MSRLAGGIGARGPGETKLETDRRLIRTRIALLERQLGELRRRRGERRKRRNRDGVPIVSIVGYTNAGKSTLLNRLTGADALAENKLFATLDPKSRRLRFPRERDLIVTDTVGFIRDLPQPLIDAFRSTLEELADADLLVHVADVASPYLDEHIAAVEGVLDELGLGAIDRLLVLNKSDRIEPTLAARLADDRGALAISARTGLGIDDLVDAVRERVRERELRYAAGVSSRPARTS